MWFGVVTLFAPMFRALTEYGVTARACREGALKLRFFSPRDHAVNAYGSVDDRPYGGGPGMLMRAEPMQQALDECLAAVSSAANDANGKNAGNAPKVIALSPQGQVLDDALVRKIASLDAVVLIAGRYEGIDERFLRRADLEVSVGDFVLSGGELAAMCVIDAVTRQLPGVLGNERSAREDCFAGGLLHFPQYTKPEEFYGEKVPAVLTGGDHQAVARWRRTMALGRTFERRPDLLAGRRFSKDELRMLDSYLRGRS